MRTREALVAGGNSHQVVETGLRETAAAATGPALVMVAALIPFATTELINVRELAVGVAVTAILLHASVPQAGAATGGCGAARAVRLVADNRAAVRRPSGPDATAAPLRQAGPGATAAPPPPRTRPGSSIGEAP